MSDPSQAPDQIQWWESQIIWKQIIIAVCTLLGGFGYVVDTQQQTQIIQGAMSIVVLIGVITTITDRAKKPCPPLTGNVLPKSIVKPKDQA